MTEVDVGFKRDGHAVFHLRFEGHVFHEVDAVADEAVVVRIDEFRFFHLAVDASSLASTLDDKMDRLRARLKLLGEMVQAAPRNPALSRAILTDG